jgi:hypothetical protein
MVWQFIKYVAVFGLGAAVGVSGGLWLLSHSTIIVVKKEAHKCVRS